MTEIAIIGEAMLELTSKESGEANLGHGGDTLNTATYLARLGHHPVFITALGHDPYSDQMESAWADEGIDTLHVLRHPSRIPGLYAIQTDAHGERSFAYWRGQSAAREIFQLKGMDEALQTARKAKWVYFSGITLSILSQQDRKRLIEFAANAQTLGCQVAFDPNYRPAGWTSPSEAKLALQEAAMCSSIVMPSIDDDNALFGPASADSHASRWHSYGADDVLMKSGEQGAALYQSGQTSVSTPAIALENPLDTTGAGDSFNAGYLSGLLRGLSPEEAMNCGHRIARTVIQFHGAITPKNIELGT